MAGNGMRMILTRQEPLGPLASDALAHHWDEFLQLYDDDNLLHRAAVNNPPTYIVGRKGSGKTSLLMGSQPEDVLAVLDTDDVYSLFSGLARRFEERVSPLYVGGLADLWELGLWHVAFLRVVQARDTTVEAAGHLQTVATYLTEVLASRKLTIDGTSSTQMFGAFASMAAATITGDGNSISTPQDLGGSLRAGGVDYADCRSAAEELLEARQRRLVVVIDNLEDLHVQVEAEELRDCLRGLLHLIGSRRFGSGDSPFLVQKCFPSELIPVLHKISSNPEKDFHHSILRLRWVAKEIVVIAARRWWIHIDVYAGEGMPPHPDITLDRLSDPDEAKRFMHAMLPERVTNSYGHREAGLAYLLRHTQLLPRHLIALINSVLQVQSLRDPSSPISEADLIRGIAATEEVLVQGILTSYRTSYEPPIEALDHLKGRVPNVLTRAELHQSFNRSGMKKLADLTFPDLVEMLVGIGALGEVTGETERYYTAKFVYTHEGDLVVPVEGDQLVAFHPLFSRHLGCPAYKKHTRPVKAVYPYGSDPDIDEDYRAEHL